MSAIDAALQRAQQLRRESHQLLYGAYPTDDPPEPERPCLELLPDPRAGTAQLVEPDNPEAWIEVDQHTPVGVPE